MKSLFIKIFSISILAFVFAHVKAYSQVEPNQNEYYLLPVIIENGDTIGQVRMNTITVYPIRNLNMRRSFDRKYVRLMRKVQRVYPYARLAVNILQKICDTLPEIATDKERRRFMRAFDKTLRTRYMDELKKLRVSEGRILLKLIDRETQYTSFYLVEELRGRFSAVFWQSLARIFGENLKTEYDPIGKDKMIEEIVVKIETGRLEAIPLP